MSAYRRPNKRVKMLHRSTPYDYIVRTKLSIERTVPESECRNILEGEILMTDPTAAGVYRSSHAHVHSDVRAFGNDLNTLLKNLQYAGIAVTGYNEATSQYAQGFMATVGGINTIMNTGSASIKAGKLIYALPRLSKGPRISGIHSSRVSFALTDKDGSDYKAAEKQNINLDKFCIGTALSSARSGQTIDVLLHSRVTNS